MPRLVRQIAINAPKEKVWEVLADFGAVSNWAPTILESRSTTEANGGVGAERTCKHQKMGDIEERIVALGGWSQSELRCDRGLTLSDQILE